jgi:sugar O-acyltransferase (sialic acid O-acetyltransferase NeuD family)
MIIYGASGHGKVIFEILRLTGNFEIQFVDDLIKNDWKYGSVLSPSSILNNDCVQGVLAIGSNAQRKKISLIYDIQYQCVIHPDSFLSISKSEIGIGTMVMRGTVVNPEVKIGRHVILNTACVIDHECILEDFVHVSPNATLCGNVKVGEGTHIGAGAVVIQGIKIGKWCTIGAGSVVIRDVPDFATVVGNPARILRIESENKGKIDL